MTLEEKAKKRRAEAYKSYSPSMKRKINRIKARHRGITPPENPKEGTYGILGRRGI